MELPSHSTISRHADKQYTHSANVEANISKLVEQFNEKGIPEGDERRCGVLQRDDFVMQAGLLYAPGSSQLVGFVYSSPFNLAETVNQPAASYAAVAPSVATHACVYFFRSHCGSVAGPVATFTTTDRTHVKDFEQSLWTHQCTSLLGLNGIVVAEIAGDGHIANVVCSYVSFCNTASG